MPRNGTGTYTLPRPPFVPGTVISSADVNADLSDIATALTGSLAANGETPLTAALRGIVSSTPAFSFVGDTDTGVGSSATDTVYIRTGGTVRSNWTSTGQALTGALTATGAGTFGGALTVSSGGATITAGGLTVTAGGLTVGAGGFTVTGNSLLTGLLTITSTTTINGGLVLAGNLAVNTNRFTVDATTGNSAILGTLVVTGRLTANQSDGIVARNVAKAFITFTTDAASNIDTHQAFNCSVAIATVGGQVGFRLTFTTPMSSDDYCVQGRVTLETSITSTMYFSSRKADQASTVVDFVCMLVGSAATRNNLNVQIAVFENA